MRGPGVARVHIQPIRTCIVGGVRGATFAVLTCVLDVFLFRAGLRLHLRSLLGAISVTGGVFHLEI